MHYYDQGSRVFVRLSFVYTRRNRNLVAWLNSIPILATIDGRNFYTAKTLKNLDGSKGGRGSWSVFWVLPPGEAFFGPFKAGNLFMSVVATLRLPIKVVGNVFAICATS